MKPGIVNKQNFINGTPKLGPKDDTQTYWLTLISNGNGSGVATLTLEVDQNVTLELDGNSKFYSNEAGTENESTTWNVTTGALRTIYIKNTSGTSNIKVPKNVIIKISAWESNTANHPILTGDLCKNTKLTKASIRGNNTLFGKVSRLTLIEELSVLGLNVLSDSISGCTKLTSINLWGLNTITGTIAPLVDLINCVIKGNSSSNSGKISGLTKAQHLEIAPVYLTSNVEYDNTTNIKGLCFLAVPANIQLTQAQVNQILTDFWTNKDEAKALTERTLSLLGEYRTPKPTGNAYHYSKLLADYKSPNRDAAKDNWAVSVRKTSACFMGTSITSGSVTTAGNDFVTLYSNLCHIQFGNYGVSGRKLSHDSYAGIDGLIDHLDWIPVKPNHARNLFLEFGANDVYVLDNNPTQFYNDYCTVIDYAVNTCGWSLSEIKLLTLFSPLTDWQAVNVIINNVGTEKGVAVIDTATQLYNGGDYAGNMHDNIHPNNAGHLVIANYLFSQVFDYWDTRYLSDDLAITNVSPTAQDISVTINGVGATGVSWEYSTDGINWTVHGTSETGLYHATTGITSNTFYYWRARLYKTGDPTTYGEYSNYAHETSQSNEPPAALTDGNTVIYSLSDDLANITKDGSNYVSAQGKTTNGGHQLVQAEAAKQPIWSETDGFIYDGTDIMQAAFDLDCPISIYMVASFNPANAAKYGLDGVNADTVNLNIGLRTGPPITVDVAYKAGGTMRVFGFDSNLAVDELALISIVIDGANSKMQVKNATATATITNLTGLGGITEACRAAYNAYYACAQKRKALIIRKVNDGTTDYNSIRNWLKTKYSV